MAYPELVPMVPSKAMRENDERTAEFLDIPGAECWKNRSRNPGYPEAGMNQKKVQPISKRVQSLQARQSACGNVQAL